MSMLDHEFKALCQRTEQAERRIARHQEQAAMLQERGQPADADAGSLTALHATLQELRSKRSEMARQMRYRARRGAN